MERRIYLPLHTVLKGKYEIEEVLGSGSFGITYSARDLVLENRVAIKEFFPSGKCFRQETGLEVAAPGTCVEEFAKGKERFRKTASLIYGGFDLPGICSVRDYFEENGTAYLVEEYLPGGTFEEYLNRKSGHMIPFEECRSMFAPVLEGLCHIHAMGIVHGDISPDNLMFTGEGALKLIDFGAAGCAEDEEAYRTDGEASYRLAGKTYRSGKEAYAPPEQFCPGWAVGPWSDLYAVCCVMYLALTGSRPVPSARRIRKDTLVPVSGYATLPERAEASLMQGLSLDVQRRYFYCGNLMEGLGMDTENVRPLLGKIRSIWGEEWLWMVTEKHTAMQKRARGVWNVRRIRQFLMLLGGAAVAGGLLFGALTYYGDTHPTEVFRYKLERARKAAQKHPQENLLLEGSETFDRILKEIEPYEREQDWQTEGYHSYDVPFATLKKLNFLNTGSYSRGKFYLKGDTVRELFSYVLGQKLELSASLYTSSVGMEMDESYGRNAIFNNSTQHDTCIYTDETGQEYELELCTDPVDDRVKTVYINGDTKTMELVLREVLPYLVPETYLTDEEIGEFLASSREAFALRSGLSEESEPIRVEEEIKNHAKMRIKLMTSVRKSYAYSKLTIEPNGVIPGGSGI